MPNGVLYILEVTGMFLLKAIEKRSQIAGIRVQPAVVIDVARLFDSRRTAGVMEMVNAVAVEVRPYIASYAFI